MATSSCRTIDSLNIKKDAKILVIGHNGTGKSLLINKLLGRPKAAIVGTTTSPTCHEGVVVEHSYDVGGVPVKIYDSRGFGDFHNTSKEILDKAKATMKTADVVLICHKLYGRVDKIFDDMLTEIVLVLGDELMKRSIIVLTFGDEYQIRCDEDVSFKSQMEEQQSQEASRIKAVMETKSIKMEIIKGIPSYVTSGRKEKLPTSGDDYWIDGLWELIENRCKPEAKPFMKWYRRYVKHLAAVGGTTVLGVASGTTIGALIGTGVIPVPGLGTAVGGVVGGVVGGIVGASSGGVAGGVASTTGVVAAKFLMADKKIKDKEEGKK